MRWQGIDIEPERRQLEDGDFLVMVTDGVLDTLPTGKQDSLMEEFICQVESQNPGEMAHHIFEPGHGICRRSAS